MTDAIDRQAAIGYIDRVATTGMGKKQSLKYIRMYLEKLPSVQSEIIRCKDCKQFRRWIDTDICFCDITEAEISNNDFCSKAERRTDD